jgi:RNA polymerase sigma factor (sigma-70 family)
MENEVANLANLIACCRKQDRKCQKLLYKSHYEFAMGICIRYARNRNEATNIMNKGFLKVFFNLQWYDLQQSFKAWLAPVMINTSVGYYRPELTEPTADDPENVNPVFNQPWADPNLGYLRLLALVQQLPDLQRLVYNLYAIDGYSDEETDTILGMGEGTCKYYLWRARDNLRKMMLYKK